MSRSYRRADAAIHVRCSTGGPEQFLWRNRLYRVNQVLQQWDTVRGVVAGCARSHRPDG